MEVTITRMALNRVHISTKAADVTEVTRFLPCDAMRKRGLCCRLASVRLIGGLYHDG